jgi:hypothetical protein
MAGTQFELNAEVRSQSADEMRVALLQLVPEARIDTTELGWSVRAQLSGQSAKELNRNLLSGLRKVERHTTLRAEWTANGSVERFFDYVFKGRRSV